VEFLRAVVRPIVTVMAALAVFGTPVVGFVAVVFLGVNLERTFSAVVSVESAVSALAILVLNWWFKGREDAKAAGGAGPGPAPEGGDGPGGEG